jgi:hypothetical protein
MEERELQMKSMKNKKEIIKKRRKLCPIRDLKWTARSDPSRTGP